MIRSVSFPPEPDGFFETVKERVHLLFADDKLNKQGNAFFFFKALLFIVIYIGLYITCLFSEDISLAFFSMVLMGPMAILIGINVAHDAAHGAISKYNLTNAAFLFLFDLLGANSYIWKKRHVFSHHSYPNILNEDADLKQNPLVRIFPNDEFRPAHRYQYLYAPLLYLFYTINWLFVRDYQDLKATKIGSLHFKKHPKSEILRLLFFKLFYASYILVFPFWFSSLSWPMVLLGFLLMNFSASLLITLALIPSHVAENSNFPQPDENGVMPTSWAHHQLTTVIDFATGNWVLNFFFGGFNHHIAHHLFPNICHVHYVRVTPVIKQTAAEFGLIYNHEKSFLNAYASHFRLLRNNGVNPLESARV